jgi:hypothetical protein
VERVARYGAEGRRAAISVYRSSFAFGAEIAFSQKGDEEAFRSASRRNSCEKRFSAAVASDSSERATPPAAASTSAMYGWERRNGAFTDHFAESITDEDVRETLERARRALVPDAIPNEPGRGSVTPSETERTRAVAPATGDDAPDASSAENVDPDATSDDRDASREPTTTPCADQTTSWAEHKRAGTEAFLRGAFRDAADRFARAASALAADAERGLEAGEDPETDASVPTRGKNTRENLAVTLAGCRSNESAARLRAGDSAGAADAARRCVAARPEWSKAHFRVGEAAFASARFEDAREAYVRAHECAVRASEKSVDDVTARDGSERKRNVDDDVAILESRIAASARAARRAAMCDEEESSLAAAAEARRLEGERKREASSDENVAKMNAEAEDRERDPRARRLLREIEALFAEARTTTKDAEMPADDTDAAKDEKKTKAFPARAALRLLAELLAIEPENVEASFQAAVLSLREENTRDAIAYARQCLARAPGFARGADFLATCLETTEEGGDRTRGDDAANARVRVSHATPTMANEVDPSPSDSEAELALVMAVMSNPETPDAWTAFARHLARRGRVSDAVAALRDALAGGPEGKWLRPRSDAALLLTLGFLLHLRGHVAEPASLYASAAAAGGGLIATMLAARVAAETGDDDEDVSRARRDAMRGAFATHAQEVAMQLEALNVAFAAPQFEVAARKHVVATTLSDAGVQDVAPPTLCWTEQKEALLCLSEGGTDASANASANAFTNAFETSERVGSFWLVKARRHAFEGFVSSRTAEKHSPGGREPVRAPSRVFACGSASEALERFARAGVGPTTATAQRYVSASAPETRAGRKVTLRLFATLSGPDSEDEEENEEEAEGSSSTRATACSDADVSGTSSSTKNQRRVFFSPRFAEGFVIRSAPRWLDGRDDDEDATDTADAPDDDFVVDVASVAEAETWANDETVQFGFGAASDDASDDARRSIDWSRTYASARRKAETYFRLADETTWRERHGERDARAAWRRVRLPKLVETAFALDGDGEPWLVDVDPFPSVVRYAAAARDGVGTTLRHLARAHDLCD